VKKHTIETIERDGYKTRIASYSHPNRQGLARSRYVLIWSSPKRPTRVTGPYKSWERALITAQSVSERLLQFRAGWNETSRAFTLPPFAEHYTEVLVATISKGAPPQQPPWRQKR